MLSELGYKAADCRDRAKRWIIEGIPFELNAVPDLQELAKRLPLYRKIWLTMSSHQCLLISTPLDEDEEVEINGETITYTDEQKRDQEMTKFTQETFTEQNGFTDQ